MSKNKVRFNLSNVHYAVHKEPTDGQEFGFETPVHVPGAVSLSLEQQGDITKFYADGVVFYQASQNNGYQGDLEMAMFPPSMLQALWGFVKDEASKVVSEYSNKEPKSFALLFQIDGDAFNSCYVLYNCTGTRPALGGQTNNETKTPQTQSSTISAAPLSNGLLQSFTDEDTPAATVQNWFKSVFMPTAPTAT